MGILDNLREKNELIDYIELRIRAHDSMDFEQYPETQRADVRMMAIGRIRELENFKEVLSTASGLKKGIRNYLKYFDRIETESVMVE
jgi:hypothetical protein